MRLTTWFRGLFGGNATDQRYGDQYNYPLSINGTSVDINEDTALKVSTVYRSIQLIANMIGSLDVEVVQVGNDNSEKTVRDELWDLLQNRPNAVQTGQEFRETLILNLMFHGNAYARITYNAVNKPIALWAIPSQDVVPDLLPSGELVYRYSEPQPNGGTRDVYIPANEVLHIKDMGSGIVGLSRIAYAANSIAVSQSQENFAHDWFKNKGQPSSVLETDQFLTPEQRMMLRQNLAADLSPSSGNNGVVLLEAGFKFKPTTFSLNDLQTLSSRQFQTEDVARWFGVPLPLLGMSNLSTDRANAVEDILRGWLMTDLRPLIKKFEDAFTIQLQTATQRRKKNVRFDVNSIFKYDISKLMDIGEKGVRNGVISQNEARKMINLPPKDGVGYDDLKQQAQMVNQESTTQPENTDEPTE